MIRVTKRGERIQTTNGLALQMAAWLLDMYKLQKRGYYIDTRKRIVLVYTAILFFVFRTLQQQCHGVVKGQGHESMNETEETIIRLLTVGHEKIFIPGAETYKHAVFWHITIYYLFCFQAKIHKSGL